MSHLQYIIYVFIMAGTTYLIRALPFVLVRKEIKNPYMRSFLNFIPYSVLAAMTFPAILYSSTYVIAALIGLIVAVILALYRQSLVRVALAACLVVYIGEAIIKLIE